MANIRDIDVGNLKIFLKENKYNQLLDDEIYNISFKLMEKNSTSYKNVPKA